MAPDVAPDDVGYDIPYHIQHHHAADAADKNRKAAGAAVVSETNAEETSKKTKQTQQLPVRAAAIISPESANHGKHDKKEDGNKSDSSRKAAGRAGETMDQAEVIVRALAQVVKLLNEFHDLNSAAQDGNNR
jgi:hypothetical protein